MKKGKKEIIFRKGDIVKVWSLQSFHGGGFLNGVEGIVSQDQYGGSVLISVERKIDGKIQVDPHYEVYPQQLKLVARPDPRMSIIIRFEELLKEIKECSNRR